MDTEKPIIGITMGDPVGIGPEILIKALINKECLSICQPVIIGDLQLLQRTTTALGSNMVLKAVDLHRFILKDHDAVAVVDVSCLNSNGIRFGQPTAATGSAMIAYINTAADLAMAGKIQAVVTCPINKKAMKMAGSAYAGHTELLATRTGAERFAMMMAGERLRVVLATIHIPLKAVPAALSVHGILETIEITHAGLMERFGLQRPSIAVAGLNPHAGENGLFGQEEEQIIAPACRMALEKGIAVQGPLPPDTVFYQAAKGRYDAVVCMYHDQGLIPFKMIHFTDGVNTTLGLPIIRTSVDHGTAYDIAGKGQADPGSLVAAIYSAVAQSLQRRGCTGGV